MIQPEFLLELLIVLLDLPACFGDLHQSSKTVINRQIAEEIPGRLRRFFRPLDQQPDLFAWVAALVKSMGRLHPDRTESRLQPTFAAFPPANLLPALGLLRSSFDRHGPLLTVVRRTWRTPGPLWFQLADAVAQAKLPWWIALLRRNAVCASPPLHEKLLCLHSRHPPRQSGRSASILAPGRSSLKPAPISFETSPPPEPRLPQASPDRSPNSPAGTNAN